MRYLAAAIILTSFALLGCATGARRNGSSPTGGVAVELLVSDQGATNSLYRVDKHGVIAWGGGIDAVVDRTTWSDQMTAEEIDELLHVLRQQGWYATRPRPDDPAAKARHPRYTLTVRGPDHKHHHDVTGACSEIEPVRELLERISRRRNAAFLETLPQPGDRIR